MTRKKETDTVVSEEDSAQVQHMLEQFHQLAGNLHSSSSQEEAGAVLSDINSMPEASQLALLKALSKERDTDAADVLIAINELSHSTNKRNVDAQIQHLRTQLPGITLVDCTLAEARRLLEEALSVNKWRGTTPHKEYRHHLPTVNQLVFGDAGEDRGLTFIDPNLEPDE